VDVQEPLELLGVQLPHGQAAAPVDGTADRVVLVVAVEVVVQVLAVELLAVEVLVLVVVGGLVLAHVLLPSASALSAAGTANRAAVGGTRGARQP
jgi:hypothetical protein